MLMVERNRSLFSSELLRMTQICTSDTDVVRWRVRMRHHILIFIIRSISWSPFTQALQTLHGNTMNPDINTVLTLFYKRPSGVCGHRPTSLRSLLHVQVKKKNKSCIPLPSSESISHKHQRALRESIKDSSRVTWESDLPADANGDSSLEQPGGVSAGTVAPVLPRRQRAPSTNTWPTIVPLIPWPAAPWRTLLQCSGGVVHWFVDSVPVRHIPAQRQHNSSSSKGCQSHDMLYLSIQSYCREVTHILSSLLSATKYQHGTLMLTTFR